MHVQPRTYSYIAIKFFAPNVESTASWVRLGMLNGRLGPTPSFACASLLAQVWYLT